MSFSTSTLCRLALAAVTHGVSFNFIFLVLIIISSLVFRLMKNCCLFFSVSTLSRLVLAAVTHGVSFNVEAEDGRAAARQQYGTTKALAKNINNNTNNMEQQKHCPS